MYIKYNKKGSAIKMAVAEITNVDLVRNEAKELVDAVAVDVTDGAKVDYTNRSDGRILLLLTNSNASKAKKATIVQGNSLQGVEDLEISIPANKTYVIVVESGKFMNVSGDNKGYVIIKGESADIKVQAVELP